MGYENHHYFMARFFSISFRRMIAFFAGYHLLLCVSLLQLSSSSLSPYIFLCQYFVNYEKFCSKKASYCQFSELALKKLIQGNAYEGKKPDAVLSEKQKDGKTGTLKIFLTLLFSLPPLCYKYVLRYFTNEANFSVTYAGQNRYFWNGCLLQLYSTTDLHVHILIEKLLKNSMRF